MNLTSARWAVGGGERVRVEALRGELADINKKLAVIESLLQ